MEPRAPHRLVGANDESDCASIDGRRRRLLTSFAAACSASLVPRALAQPSADAGHAAFLALSAMLVGRASLDSALAARLYAALIAEDGRFPDATRALLALIEQRHVDPMRLQALLDDERSAFAALPRKIVTAWYMGIVGDGEHARFRNSTRRSDWQSPYPPVPWAPQPVHFPKDNGYLVQAGPYLGRARRLRSQRRRSARQPRPRERRGRVPEARRPALSRRRHQLSRSARRPATTVLGAARSQRE